MAGLQGGLAGRPGTGEQTTHPHLATGDPGQALQDLTGRLQLSHPEGPGEPAIIHHECEGNLQGRRLLAEALQGEKVGEGIRWMAPVEQLLQPVASRWTQPIGSPQQHPLPHRRFSRRQGTPARPAPWTSSG
jgi:hypothetical protein